MLERNDTGRARSLSDIAFVTGRRRYDQLRGRRLGKTGGVFAEYAEDFFWPRTTQMVTDHSPQ
jgi:hypothetical protein